MQRESHGLLIRTAIAAALVLGLLGGLCLAGCTPRIAEKTVIVQRTPEVIERIITATPAPTATPTPMARAFIPGQLEVHVLDVKHGDAQLIVSPSGETMLIDVGREEYASRTAEYLRQVLGDLAVDYLMLSHYHVDHIQAFVLLMEEGLQVRRAILDRGGGRDEYDSDHYRRFYDYVSDPANGLTRVRVYPGDQIDMGPDISVDVLSVGDIDTRTACGIPVVGENDNCIALWVSFGDFDYWTAGDLTGVDSIRHADVESAVIPLLPREVDVYRANHHAIQYNSNPGFLAALNPTVSIASTSNEVVSWSTVLALEEYGDLYMTDEIPAHKASGDIVLATREGKTYTVEGKSYVSKE